MKILKLNHYLLLAVLCMAGACNTDRSTPVEELTQKEISLSDEEQLPAVPAGEDTASVDGGTATIPLNKVPVKKEPAQNPPRSSTTTQQPKPTQPVEVTKPSPANPSGQLEGTYRLASVQGEELPLVLDMTTECDVKLLSGELMLNKGGFRFKSNTAEECSGKIGNQEIQQATGTYKVEGNQLLLTVSSGEVLGDAKGVIEGTKLRLQHISNDAEEQEVDWLFELQ